MIVALWLVARPVQAATLSNIQVDNSPSNAQVTLSFMDGKPDYKYFPLHSPERLVIDVKQNGEIIGLPMRVPAGDLVKVVRTSQPPDSRHKRIVLELSKAAKVQTSLKQVAGQYQVVFTLSSGQSRAPTSFNNTTQPMQVPNNAVQDKPLKMNSQAQRPAVAPAPVKTNKTMPKGQNRS